MVENERSGPVDWVTWTFSRVAMWAPAAVVAIIFYEVFMRYVLFKPTLWANEMSLWIGGAIYVTSGLYAMQQRSHIRIYIIYDIMPRWAQKLSDCISVALIWLFTIALFWGGYNEARDKLLRMETFGTAWDPPIPATVKVGILVIIAMVVMSWLIGFNVINRHNQVVDMIWRTLLALTEPVLRPIRNMLPAMGGLDLSPLILLLAIFFLQGMNFWLRAKIGA